MKTKLSLPFLMMSFFIAQAVFSQTNASLQEEVESIRIAKDKQMSNPENSILNAEQVENFTGLSYFPVNSDYLIQGEFIADDSQQETSLNTTSGNKINLIQVGTVNFEYEGKPFSLAVYQNNSLPEFGENHRQLFIPFSDLTTGKETNVGGRYLPVETPGEDKIIMLDFNKAMNPYSAYNDNHPGIIPPVRNTLNIQIMAGERKFEDR